MKCDNCGTENPDGAKFCIKCGASLAAPATTAPVAAPPAAPTGAAAPPAPPAASPPPPAPAQAPAPPHAPEAAYAPRGAGGPAVASGGQTPAYGTPPLAYTPPSPGMPPGGAVPPAPGGPVPPAYGMPVAKKHTKLYIGSLLALLGGIVVVVSTWLPWAGSFGLNITGWDIFNGADNIGQRFIQVVDGKPTFTGLTLVIVGGLLILFALVMVLSRKKGLAVLTLVFALGAVALAVITMISLKTLGSGGFSFGLSLQYGSYLMGAFGVVGVAGSIVALAD